MADDDLSRDQSHIELERKVSFLCLVDDMLAVDPGGHSTIPDTNKPKKQETDPESVTQNSEKSNQVVKHFSHSKSQPKLSMVGNLQETTDQNSIQLNQSKDTQSALGKEHPDNHGTDETMSVEEDAVVSRITCDDTNMSNDIDTQAVEAEGDGNRHADCPGQERASRDRNAHNADSDRREHGNGHVFNDNYSLAYDVDGSEGNDEFDIEDAGYDDGDSDEEELANVLPTSNGTSEAARDDSNPGGNSPSTTITSAQGATVTRTSQSRGHVRVAGRPQGPQRPLIIDAGMADDFSDGEEEEIFFFAQAPTVAETAPDLAPGELLEEAARAGVAGLWDPIDPLIGTAPAQEELDLPAQPTGPDSSLYASAEESPLIGLGTPPLLASIPQITHGSAVHHLPRLNHNDTRPQNLDGTDNQENTPAPPSTVIDVIDLPITSNAAQPQASMDTLQNAAVNNPSGAPGRGNVEIDTPLNITGIAIGRSLIVNGGPTQIGTCNNPTTVFNSSNIRDDDESGMEASPNRERQRFVLLAGSKRESNGHSGLDDGLTSTEEATEDSVNEPAKEQSTDTTREVDECTDGETRQLASAENDFLSLEVKRNLSSPVLDQRKRTEQDADALLDQIISGQAERGMGPNAALDQVGCSTPDLTTCLLQPRTGCIQGVVDTEDCRPKQRKDGRNKSSWSGCETSLYDSTEVETPDETSHGIPEIITHNTQEVIAASLAESSGCLDSSLAGDSEGCSSHSKVIHEECFPVNHVEEDLDKSEPPSFDSEQFQPGDMIADTNWNLMKHSSLSVESCGQGSGIEIEDVKKDINCDSKNTCHPKEPDKVISGNPLESDGHGTRPAASRENDKPLAAPLSEFSHTDKTDHHQCKYSGRESLGVDANTIVESSSARDLESQAAMDGSKLEHDGERLATITGTVCTETSSASVVENTVHGDQVDLMSPTVPEHENCISRDQPCDIMQRHPRPTKPTPSKDLRVCSQQRLEQEKDILMYDSQEESMTCKGSLIELLLTKDSGENHRLRQTEGEAVDGTDAAKLSSEIECSEIDLMAKRTSSDKIIKENKTTEESDSQLKEVNTLECQGDESMEVDTKTKIAQLAVPLLDLRELGSNLAEQTKNGADRSEDLSPPRSVRCDKKRGVCPNASKLFDISENLENSAVCEESKTQKSSQADDPGKKGKDPTVADTHTPNLKYSETLVSETVINDCVPVADDRSSSVDCACPAVQNVDALLETRKKVETATVIKTEMVQTVCTSVDQTVTATSKTSECDNNDDTNANTDVDGTFCHSTDNLHNKTDPNRTAANTVHNNSTITMRTDDANSCIPENDCANNAALSLPSSLSARGYGGARPSVNQPENDQPVSSELTRDNFQAHILENGEATALEHVAQKDVPDQLRCESNHREPKDQNDSAMNMKEHEAPNCNGSRCPHEDDILVGHIENNSCQVSETVLHGEGLIVIRNKTAGQDIGQNVKSKVHQTIKSGNEQTNSRGKNITTETDYKTMNEIDQDQKITRVQQIGVRFERSMEREQGQSTEIDQNVRGEIERSVSGESDQQVMSEFQGNATREGDQSTRAESDLKAQNESDHNSQRKAEICRSDDTSQTVKCKLEQSLKNKSDQNISNDSDQNATSFQQNLSDENDQNSYDDPEQTAESGQNATALSADEVSRTLEMEQGLSNDCYDLSQDQDHAPHSSPECHKKQTPQGTDQCQQPDGTKNNEMRMMVTVSKDKMVTDVNLNDSEPKEMNATRGIDSIDFQRSSEVRETTLVEPEITPVPDCTPHTTSDYPIEKESPTEDTQNSQTIDKNVERFFANEKPQEDPEGHLDTKDQGGECEEEDPEVRRIKAQDSGTDMPVTTNHTGNILFENERSEDTTEAMKGQLKSSGSQTGKKSTILEILSRSPDTDCVNTSGDQKERDETSAEMVNEHPSAEGGNHVEEEEIPSTKSERGFNQKDTNTMNALKADRENVLEVHSEVSTSNASYANSFSSSSDKHGNYAQRNRSNEKLGGYNGKDRDAASTSTSNSTSATSDSEGALTKTTSYSSETEEGRLAHSSTTSIHVKDEDKKTPRARNSSSSYVDTATSFNEKKKRTEERQGASGTNGTRVCEKIEDGTEEIHREKGNSGDNVQNCTSTEKVILEATDVWLKKISDFCKSPTVIADSRSDAKIHEFTAECKSQILSISKYKLGTSASMQDAGNTDSTSNVLQPSPSKSTKDNEKTSVLIPGSGTTPEKLQGKQGGYSTLTRHKHVRPSTRLPPNGGSSNPDGKSRLPREPQLPRPPCGPQKTPSRARRAVLLNRDQVHCPEGDLSSMAHPSHSKAHGSGDVYNSDSDRRTNQTREKTQHEEIGGKCLPSCHTEENPPNASEDLASTNTPPRRCSANRLRRRQRAETKVEDADENELKLGEAFTSPLLHPSPHPSCPSPEQGVPGKHLKGQYLGPEAGEARHAHKDGQDSRCQQSTGAWPWQRQAARQLTARPKPPMKIGTVAPDKPFTSPARHRPGQHGKDALAMAREKMERKYSHRYKQ